GTKARVVVEAIHDGASPGPAEQRAPEAPADHLSLQYPAQRGPAQHDVGDPRRVEARAQDLAGAEGAKPAVLELRLGLLSGRVPCRAADRGRRDTMPVQEERH